MSIEWNWVPHQSLGPIKLGAPIAEYIESLGALKDDSFHDETDWESYELPEHEVSLDAGEGRVEQISAYEAFWYEDKNLIGMTTQGVKELMKGMADGAPGTPVEHEDGDVLTPYDYDAAGLQVWARDGIVVSAHCVTFLD